MNPKTVIISKITTGCMFIFILILNYSPIFAADINIPNTFSQGEVISANKMNENFSALKTAINSRLEVYAPDDTFLGILVDIGSSNASQNQYESITIYNNSIGKFISIIGNGFPSTSGSGSGNTLLFESTDCSGQPNVVLTSQGHYFVHVIQETYDSQSIPPYTYSYYVPKTPQVYFEQKSILSISEWVHPTRVCSQITPQNIGVIPVESINLTLFDNIPFFPLTFK